MIATSVAYAIVFVVHILAAVAILIVFVTMRFAALSVARGADAATQALRFPQRRNWAARLLHVIPITGLIMSLSGNSSVALSKPWIGVGIVCYVLAAGHMEARVLPLEREVAATIARDGTSPKAQGQRMVRSVDVLLGLIAIAFIAMLVQF